jgi:hypothetical protein
VEISDSHLAAEDERSGSSEEAQDQEQPTDGFNGTGNTVQARKITIDAAAREAPQLFESMLDEQESGHQSYDAYE